MSPDIPTTDPFLADPPGSDDADEEDWFGEGSGFDSSEDLAAALFSMANVVPPPGLLSDATQRAAAHGQLVGHLPPPAADGAVAAHAETEWMPIPTQPWQGQAVLPHSVHPSWTVRQAKEETSKTGADEGRQWSIRHGVNMLKLTEDVIDRLRQNAIEVTWAAASLAISQQSTQRRARRAKRSRAAA